MWTGLIIFAICAAIALAISRSKRHLKVINQTLDNDRAAFPHCDDLVLHAPGHCEYCDVYPDRQMERLRLLINFTGQSIPGRAKCPSEVRRPLEVSHAWFGNRPKARGLGAYTDLSTSSYPGFVGIEYTDKGVRIYARSPAGEDGSCGSCAEFTVPYEHWARMVTDLGLT